MASKVSFEVDSPSTAMGFCFLALDWPKGNITMAGVFGKDPNMKKSNHAELERLNLERKRKLAEAAIKFNQKKPVAPQQP